MSVFGLGPNTGSARPAAAPTSSLFESSASNAAQLFPTNASSSRLQPSTPAATSNKALKPNPDLSCNKPCPLAVLKSYKSGKFTDLTISCGPFRFSVHQIIVCSACEFFEKCITFGKEGTEKHIDLPEDDPEIIRRLIAYCYLGNYDPCSSVALGSFSNLKEYTSTTPVVSVPHSRLQGLRAFSDPQPCCACACLMPNTPNLKQATAKSSTPSIGLLKSAVGVEVADPLEIHATMYALADKYQVNGLGSLARAKFEACLNHHVNTEDFITAVQIVYSTTPESNRGLRDAVVQAFLEHFNVDLASIPGIEDKLDCLDDLSLLLLKAWPSKKDP